MKRISLCLLLCCIFLLSSCGEIPRLKPWKIDEQNPNNTGILFLKINPTVKYYPAAYTECRSMWSLDGPDSIDHSKSINYGLIETPHLFDGRYIIYPLKSGYYRLTYATFIVMSGQSRIQYPYTLDFQIKPGEIAYLGSFKPIDKFVYNKSWDKGTSSYNFITMEKYDDYKDDIKWLTNWCKRLFDNFQPINYCPEIKDIKKQPK